MKPHSLKPHDPTGIKRKPQDLISKENLVQLVQLIQKKACEVLAQESEAIASLKNCIDHDFVQAVQKLGQLKGKLIVTGIGKSGHIARKIASTFASTGTSALFLHPAESSHGDLGMISNEDMVLAISYSGNSKELFTVVNYATRRNIPIFVMSKKKESPLGVAANYFIHVKVEKEACPLGLAPTSSSTATLAMGDALAMSLLQYKGFRKEDFAELHPGGSLGESLTKVRKVHELMQTGDKLPLLSMKASMLELLSIMTHKDIRGIAGIVDEQGDLIGVVTDGDLRRYLQSHGEKGKDKQQGKEKKKELLQVCVQELMGSQPKMIESHELVQKALFLMERFSIQALFVVKSGSASSTSSVSSTSAKAKYKTETKTKTKPKPIGIIHLQDLLRDKIS